MGTSVAVTVVGEGPDAVSVVAELERLERRWSRFLPNSELSRLNDVAGSLAVVSPGLFVLVEHLVAAHSATGGRFDPSMEQSMVSIGYHASFESLTTDPRPPSAVSPPAGLDIDLLRSASAVRLPVGVRLDPGGLGKGLAADLVSDSVMSGGATGVLVDLGGDVVTRGRAPDGGPWRVEVPSAGRRPPLVVDLFDGAVATSDTTVRRWRRGGATFGHILDPSTGSSLTRDLRATVIAGAGWWAEAAATAAIVSTAHGDGWVDEFAASGSVAELWVDDPVRDVELFSRALPSATQMAGAHG